MVGKALVLACVGAAGVALALSTVAGGHNNVTVLRGVVGPGFMINLTKNGRKVTRLAPGMYRLVTSDRSGIHDFKLEKTGGAFERVATSVAFKGTRTIAVRLTAGRWEYYCQPHERSMKGHFVVGSVAPAPSPTTTNDDHGGNSGHG